MDRRKIDVDDDVWELLKKNAQASGESPNDVVKRLLMKEGKPKAEKKTGTSDKSKDWKCS